MFHINQRKVSTFYPPVFMRIFNFSQFKNNRVEIELGNMETIKYYDIFDQLHRCQYCSDIVGLTIVAFTENLHNDIIFDK